MKKFSLILLCTITFLLIDHPGFSQVSQDSLKARIQPIPISAIIQKSEAENALFDKINSFLVDENVLDDIKTEFDSISKEVDPLVNEITSSIINKSRIANLENSLGLFLVRLESFEKTLNNRNLILENYRINLRNDRLLWAKTLEVTDKEDSPDAVIQRLQEVLDGISRIDKALVVKEADVFKLLSEVIGKKRLVQNNLTVLQELKSELVQNVFEIDSPPFWALSMDSVQVSKSIEDFGRNWKNSKGGLNTYLNTNKELLIGHFIIIILITILIIYLKRKEEKLIAYSDQKELWILFDHPLELAMVLGVVGIVPFYKQLPVLAVNILVIFVYLVVLRVLFKIIDKGKKIAFFFLAFFLVFNTMMDFVQHAQLPSRVVMLIQSIISVAIIYPIVRKGFREDGFYGLWIGRWMAYFLPLAGLLFGFSIISNLLGAAVFTHFILYGTVRIIAIGTAVFAGVMTLNGIVKIFLRNPGSQAMYIVKEYSAVIEKRVGFILQLLFLFLWMRFSLRSFKVWDFFTVMYVEILDYNMKLGNFAVSLREIIAFIITIIVTVWLARILRIILEKEVFQRMTLPRGVSGVISTSIYYLILVTGFIIAMGQTGVEASQISIIIGALGVGIGFGLQNIISNFISGIILVFERPVQQGDTVEVGQLMGDVTSIGIRSSKIRTYDGSEVIVPNNNLISNEVINWTLSDRRRRMTIELGVAYGTNPGQVAKMLKETAAAHPKTLKFPEPLSIFVGFGESSLKFKIHFWTSFEDGYTTKSDVTIAIYDALEKEGIEIPFPQRVVTIKKDEDKE